jgi:hypothetical protein
MGKDITNKNAPGIIPYSYDKPVLIDADIEDGLVPFEETNRSVVLFDIMRRRVVLGLEHVVPCPEIRFSIGILFPQLP